MTDIALMYFYETAMLGTMRQASDKIGVAVSSISRQITQLEQQLGMPLIERGRRTIKVTPAGEVALEYYRTQQADREAFLNRLADLRGFRTGNVDLAVGEGFLGRSFTEIVEQFQRDNPRIELSIVSASTAEIVRMVLNDEAHIGLIFQSENEPKIRVRTSALQPLMVICSPTHPLAADDGVTLPALAEQSLCLPPKGFRIRQTLAAAELRFNVWLQPQLTTGSIHVMREIAKEGRAVTVLPPISVLSDLEEGSLVALPLMDADLEHTTIGLIHRLGRQLSGPPGRMLSLLEKRVRGWTVSSAAD
ncbi:LysR family transcriptional regulator [Porphyrobacter algicida]|uniref:LysR family transcriptional regulator n=1 Tax=Qipengyuania algicida TaxID=1836209 RepID=A0A845AK67_9SPHN|nr:LysR family transcriptional regulator [Qipengyuania algicida]MXP29291.1 LysR family transcriptional regulator [Qipengyuania algicida]